MRIISYLTKLVFVTTMFLTSVVAQTLTGKVTDNDSGDPLVGAQVFVKGTFNGTTTDVSGSYSLDVSDNVTVTVAYMGYKTSELLTSGGTADFS